MSLSQNYPTTRPTLTLDFAKAKRVDPRVTFTRASTATYFDASGTLRSAQANAPRIDFNPSTLLCQGLLVEEQRTNICLQSADFGTTWSASNSTISTDSTTSPDGSANADTLIESLNVTATAHSVSQNITVSASTVYTFSVFLKTAGRNAYIRYDRTGNSVDNIIGTLDLSTGTVVSAVASGVATLSGSSIIDVGGGWYRCTLSGSLGANTDGRVRIFTLDGSTVSYIGDGTSGVYIWGAQLEAGAFPTSYIPTTTTSLTRSADVASVTTLSPWFNAAESTLYLEAVPVGVRSAASPIVTIDDGTTSNRIAMTATSANTMQNSTVVSGVLSGNTTTPATTYAAGSTYKIAFAVQLDNVQSASGGASGVVDTTALIPSGLTALKFTGQGASSGLNNFWFRRFTYYPRRLSSAELAAITA